MDETLDLCRRKLTSTLLHAGRQWRRLAEQALVRHPISEALAAPLIWIGRLGDGVRQVTLAAHVGIEGPSLVRLLDQLEALQLVTRREDPADRRAKNLWLTEAGAELAARSEAALNELRGQVLASIGQADLEAALRVLSVFGGLDDAEGGESGT